MLAGQAAGILFAALAAPTPAPDVPKQIVIHFVKVDGRSVMRATDAIRMIEAVLLPALRAQLGGDVPFTDVRCPNVIADGRKQTCPVLVAGTPLRFRISAFDLGNGRGPIAAHTDESLLDLRKVEQYGHEYLPSSDPAVTSIACDGPRWRPTEVDEMFTCRARTTDGKPVRVLVHASSEMGEVDLRVIP